MRRPRPGSEKIVSVNTAPESSRPSWSPITVTIGMSALRSIWRKITRAARKPLGSGGAHMVLRRRRQHLGARDARDQGERDGRERARREGSDGAAHPRTSTGCRQAPRRRRLMPVMRGGSIPDFGKPADRQPVERRAEEQKQHQPEPEDRHRDAEEREGHRQIVEVPPGLSEAKTPTGTPMKVASARAARVSCKVTGKAVLDIREGGAIARQRGAEIAMRRGADEAQILDDDRLVEPELKAKLRRIARSCRDRRARASRRRPAAHAW